MKVKLLTGMAGTRDGAGFSHLPGEVVEFDNATAKRLLDSGQAVPVAEKRQERAEKRVVKAPESRG